MPYIKKSDRVEIDAIIEQLTKITLGPGEINYAITKFLHRILEGTGLSYDMLNCLVGVLECAKLELYRMVVAPYEGKKRMENGPISFLDAKSLEDVR